MLASAAGDAPNPPVPDGPPLVETGSRSPRLSTRVADVWANRELLVNLTRKEVKVRHKNSVLGMAWNLLNPLLHLTIFSVVFTFFLPTGAPRYPLKLLSGLVIFQLFSMGVTAAAASVTGNASLVKKIWFPREILPIAAVGSNLVTFLSRMGILLIGLAVFRQSPEWSMVWLVVPAVLVTLLLAVGLGILLAAVNVYFRDVQHFLELALLALFWFTPVVYAYDLVGGALTERFGAGAERLAMLNPLIPVVTTFQRVLYNPTNFGPEAQAHFALLLRPTSWYIQNLALSGLVGCVLVVVGIRIFARLEGAYAERL